jgi:hypothetical protein
MKSKEKQQTNLGMGNKSWPPGRKLSGIRVTTPSIARIPQLENTIQGDCTRRYTRTFESVMGGNDGKATIWKQLKRKI